MIDTVRTIRVSDAGAVARLFQKQFLIEAEVGQSVRDLLTLQYGIDREMVDTRVKTVLLDSQPVDDIDRAIIRDGSTLALSGAMPGLVGAILRAGSFYAPMRGTITYHADARERDLSGSGTVTVKLFNTLVAFLGPYFLRKGIVVSAADFAGAALSIPHSQRKKIFHDRSDDRPLKERDFRRFEEGAHAGERVRLVMSGGAETTA